MTTPFHHFNNEQTRRIIEIFTLVNVRQMTVAWQTKWRLLS